MIIYYIYLGQVFYICIQESVGSVRDQKSCSGFAYIQGRIGYVNLLSGPFCQGYRITNVRLGVQ